jgi:hypothetical protein
VDAGMTVEELCEPYTHGTVTLDSHPSVLVSMGQFYALTSKPGVSINVSPKVPHSFLREYLRRSYRRPKDADTTWHDTELLRLIGLELKEHVIADDGPVHIKTFTLSEVQDMIVKANETYVVPKYIKEMITCHDMTNVPFGGHVVTLADALCAIATSGNKTSSGMHTAEMDDTNTGLNRAVYYVLGAINRQSAILVGKSLDALTEYRVIHDYLLAPRTWPLFCDEKNGTLNKTIIAHIYENKNGVPTLGMTLALARKHKRRIVNGEKKLQCLFNMGIWLSMRNKNAFRFNYSNHVE